jgi:O-antigen/teichoic acid export membrane protein
LLCFTAVVAAALWTRSAVVTVAVLAAANLIPAIAFAAPARVEGTALRHASAERLRKFLIYAKPIVLSLVVYQLIALINRQVALAYLGAETTGQYSLATDLGQRLFGAASSLPELMLFQYVLKIDRSEGRAAAERQQGRNVALALGLLAPLAAGYAAMAPTLETLIAPAAYRGAFGPLSAELAAGYFALFAIISGIGPIFQLQGLTWPLSLAALVALAVDLALLGLTNLAASADGLAIAYSASLMTAFAAAGLLALWASKVRPRARDLIVIAAASALMAALVRPLNGLSSPLAAAALAVTIAAAVLGAAYLAFDVGGLRAFLFGPDGRWPLRGRPVEATLRGAATKG